jgi:hypothetical protein
MLPTGWRRVFAQPKRPKDLSRVAMEKFNGEISGKLEKIAEVTGAQIIKPMDHLCGKDTCPVLTQQGNLIYFDENHLRASFVRESATYVDRIFQSDP